MTIKDVIALLLLASFILQGCGGGGSADPVMIDQPESQIIDDLEDGEGTNPDPVVPDVDASLAVKALYRVTLENMWGAEDYPQDFPSDAHLSLLGGATHNSAVSFWDFGELASAGIEDMAETGRIDILLFDEVTPAIVNGTAGSTVEIREYTDPKIDGVPGSLIFNIEMNTDWPLISLVTMLGPSPDWFVGVSGLSLKHDGKWVKNLSVELPLLDGGSKSDMTPRMGGPDIIPPNPISYIAYEEATGVYLPSVEPQNVARLTFDRLDPPTDIQADMNQPDVSQ